MICPARVILNPPLPLLVTGIAGVGGYNAFRHFHARYPGQVIGIRRADNWPLSGDGIVPCDMTNDDQLRRLFDQHQFASVLSCEGNCRLKHCELDPAMAWRINVSTIENLLAAIEGTNTRLVHLSIDLVYSGIRNGAYIETDPVDPVTMYGKSMAAAESIIMDRRPESCILRISLPMGISFNGHAGAIDWIQHRFQADKPATLYFDEIRTPAYTDCLNEVCSTVLARPEIHGVYHAGGPVKLSLYQIAQIVNRVGGYDPNHLMGCYRIEAGPVPPRAGNVSMRSVKLAEALQFDPFAPWPYHPEFIPTDPAWHYERPADENGSPDLLAQVLYRRPNEFDPMPKGP